MKNNIKKRPRFSLSEFKGTKQQCLDQMRFLYEKWFEDFERELNEKLTKEQGLVTLNDDDCVQDVLIGIKDILGDS